MQRRGRDNVHDVLRSSVGVSLHLPTGSMVGSVIIVGHLVVVSPSLWGHCWLINEIITAVNWSAAAIVVGVAAIKERNGSVVDLSLLPTPLENVCSCIGFW